QSTTWSGALPREELGGEDSVEHMAAVDFDEDGVDEIVELWRTVSEGSGVQTLVVIKLAGRALTHALEQQVGWQNATEGWSCTASIGISAPDQDGRRGIVVSTS